MGVVTVRDVARVAGVSVKTVSNSLNGVAGVRESTRQRVKSAAQQLGYRPNPAARILRSARTGVIGMCVPDLTMPWYAELADAVIEQAQRVDVSISLLQTGFVSEDQLPDILQRHTQYFDGLLLCPWELSQTTTPWAQSPIPVVLLRQAGTETGIDCVYVDQRAAARAATNHLLAAGCRSIAVIGTPHGPDGTDLSLRYDGFRLAMRERRRQVSPNRIGTVSFDNRADGWAAMNALLSAGETIDGVVALSDTLALGAMRALLDRGVQIPSDVALIGIGNIDEGSFALPPLSTVDLNQAELAATAMSIVGQRMDKPDHTDVNQQVVVDHTVISRHTTAAPLTA